LLTACGYAPVFEMNSYSWDVNHRVDLQERILAAGDAILRRHGLTVRTVDMARYDDELENLRLVYNRSFSNHPELVPISRDVFGAQAAELRSIIDPELVRIICKDGETVAFALLVPDLNELLHGGSGRITPRLATRLLVRREYRVRGIRSAVVVMIGAAPEYAGLGLGRLLAAEIARIPRAGRYDVIDTTWVHEQNRWSRAIVRQLRADPNKRYQVFERAL
jgi:GNAT superfamily N-acetyltransferase